MRGEQPLDEERDARAVAVVDPELGYLKQAYGPAVNRAVSEALGALAAEPRTVLQLHYVDGLSIEHVGRVYGKSRATAARMLAEARRALMTEIRGRLGAALGVPADEADSLVALVRSRLDLSLARALGRPAARREG